MKTLRSVFISVSPVRGLVEAFALGVLIMWILSSMVGQVSPLVFNSGELFLCGFCGTWLVLRIRLPRGTVLKQIFIELINAAAVSGMMLGGLRLVGYLTGWERIWLQTSWGFGTASYFLGLTGFGYGVCRGVLRLWLLWDQMRQKRLLWSMTYSIMLVVVLGAVVGVPLAFLITPYSDLALRATQEANDPITKLVSSFLLTTFPLLNIIVVMTAGSLLVLLPPSALFSFLVARWTTRRLEQLAQVTGALSAGDYTSRVKVEGEDEVAHLQRDFNLMAEKLQGSMQDLQQERDRVADLLKSRREMIALVSHELRTPLAVMRALLETSLEDYPQQSPATIQKSLEAVQDETLRLQALIDEFFLLAQADTGQLSMDVQAVDIIDLIQKRVAVMAPLAWQSGSLELVSELPAVLPYVWADPARVEQILSNLVRNALRHTPPGGIVLVSASLEGQWVRLDVRDTGEGIPPEEIPLIWDRFYRGSKAREKDASGSGLGLTLVKELSESMGGKVEITSQIGRGSVFSVFLPLVVDKP
jgi:signal transduction histidine kinase